MITILTQTKLLCAINTRNSACQFKNSGITCDSAEKLDLKKEFQILSNSLSPNKKSFDHFYLNAPIDEIPENVFIDIKFKLICIINSNFTRIHSNAFESTAVYTTLYSDISENSKLSNSPPDYDIYKAFSSLVNLEELQINLDGDVVHDVPDNAFNKFGQLNFLKSIEFKGNYEISRIGNFVFKNTPKLTNIYYSIKAIHSISSHAFDFSYYQPVTIHIKSTQINESCLETGIFQGSAVDLYLRLGNI